MTDPAMRALAYLSRVVEPPCPELTALVAQVGPVEAADRVKRRAIDDRLLGLTEARYEIDCAARDLAALERLGGRLVTADGRRMAVSGLRRVRAAMTRKHRPEAHPPLALWVIGPARLDEVADRAAAIVGTRAATAYGEHVAAELAAGLAERDAAVVSGGAYGIDGAAHRAALAADGFTVAVLAAGIDVSYPAGHTALFRRIGEQGLLVTEYPPGIAASAAPVPDSQPARRCALGGDGGGRGRCPQRRCQHGGVGAGAGPRGLRGARSGHLVGVRRLPCSAASRRDRGDTRRRGRGTDRACRRVGGRRRAAAVPVGRPRRERAACLRRAAGPRRAHRRRDRGCVRYATDAGAWARCRCWRLRGS